MPERVESPDGPRLLVGIGLNVRTNLADAPLAIRTTATTVEELRGPSDLADLREKEDETLNSYGWVDRNAGVVRIPIDEAIKLTLQRGLPARQGQKP